MNYSRRNIAYGHSSSASHLSEDESQYEARGHREDAPLSVGQLNWFIKNTLEAAVPRVWVEGEVSDLSQPSSGHIYFSLKDDQSQVRAVVWRSTANRQKFTIKDGMSIVCCGAIEVYPPRGSYQLIVDRIVPAGIGPLQLAFQQLHEKLASQGLFAPERKSPLPRFPKRIGFITSPSGAAIRDFIEAAKSRWTQWDLTVLPARVQGEQAASEIARAIRLAQNIRPQLDLLIVGRGGGSIEDLWSFNDEKVVRAIANSSLPTISAVGHDVDVTLSDLAADARALTPTHAAQLALPSREEFSNQLRQLTNRLSGSLRSRTRADRMRIDTLMHRSILARPHEIHKGRRQQVDEVEIRTRRHMRNILQSQRDALQSMTRAIEALSPLNVLSRGYSITQDANSATPITSAQQAKVGQVIRTQLRDGSLTSKIESVETGSSVESSN